MWAQRFRTITPGAVSQLFGACVSAESGNGLSLYEFCDQQSEFSNQTTAWGTKALNRMTRAQNNGALAGLPDGQAAQDKERKEEFEEYMLQLWLSRMSEDYQRSYRELMKTLDEADEFCKNAKREIAKRILWADQELDRLHDQVVVIDGEECFIRDGVLVGRNGLPSKLSKEKQDEAWHIYANDPKRRAAAERGGQVIDFREQNKELSAKVDAHGQYAKETRELAEKQGMTEDELRRKEKRTKDENEELKKEMDDVVKQFQQGASLPTKSPLATPADILEKEVEGLDLREGLTSFVQEKALDKELADLGDVEEITDRLALTFKTSARGDNLQADQRYTYSDKKPSLNNSFGM